MDGTLNSIRADDLYARLGTASAPIVLDVVSAVRCNFASERQWLDGLPTGTPTVVYCADGGEVSQAAAALGKAGISESYLTGGIAGWQQRGLHRCLGAHTVARSGDRDFRFRVEMMPALAACCAAGVVLFLLGATARAANGIGREAPTGPRPYWNEENDASSLWNVVCWDRPRVGNSRRCPGH